MVRTWPCFDLRCGLTWNAIFFLANFMVRSFALFYFRDFLAFLFFVQVASWQGNADWIEERSPHQVSYGISSRISVIAHHILRYQGQAAFSRPISELQVDRFAALFLAIRLCYWHSSSEIRVENEEKYPHLLSVTSIFIRGSVVRYFFFMLHAGISFHFFPRYVHLSKDDVDIDILQASFPTFCNDSIHGLCTLTVPFRIRRARKQNAILPKLPERSSYVLAINTHNSHLFRCFYSIKIYAECPLNFVSPLQWMPCRWYRLPI
jgi:hypothetical protein